LPNTEKNKSAFFFNFPSSIFSFPFFYNSFFSFFFFADYIASMNRCSFGVVRTIFLLLLWKKMTPDIRNSTNAMPDCLRAFFPARKVSRTPSLASCPSGTTLLFQKSSAFLHQQTTNNKQKQMTSFSSLFFF
jgi:hypothetical protein